MKKKIIHAGIIALATIPALFFSGWLIGDVLDIGGGKDPIFFAVPLTLIILYCLSRYLNKETKKENQKLTTVFVALGIIYLVIYGVLASGELPPVKYDEILAKAETGDAQAQYELGRSYHHGRRPLKQDFEAAYKWYYEAAVNGEGDAAFHIKDMYLEGQGVPKDKVKAYMWHRIGLMSDQSPGNDEYQIESDYNLAPEQIAEARKLVKEWQAEHRK